MLDVIDRSLSGDAGSPPSKTSVDPASPGVNRHVADPDAAANQYRA
jgi:hypothetical protein